MGEFTGISSKAFKFLKELYKNNNSEWYRENKPVFEKELQEPVRALLADVSAACLKNNLGVCADPKKSLFRMNRDVRFSNNKDPYKTHLGAVLTRTGEKDDPGAVYLHLEPGKSFLGTGFWHPDPILLRKWRNAMAANPTEFLKMCKALSSKGYELTCSDDALKRIPRGFEQFEESPLGAYLKFKNFLVSTPISDTAVADPAFAKTLLKHIKDVMPLLQFGWTIAGPAVRNSKKKSSK